VTQLKITIFRRSNLIIIILIRVFKTEESETANTYVGRKAYCTLNLPVVSLYVGQIVTHKN
jgi:hypothetical protein